MFVAVIVIHVLVCVSLILVVLMQSSKGEGLAGSAFGGGLSSAVFGGRGAATFLSKATTYLAIAFMVLCMTLAWMSAQTRSAAIGTQGTQTPTGESAVTREAQQERDQQMQRQQQQQGLPGGEQGGQTAPAGGGTQPAPSGGTQPSGTQPSGGGGQ